MLCSGLGDPEAGPHPSRSPRMLRIGGHFPSSPATHQWGALTGEGDWSTRKETVVSGSCPWVWGRCSPFQDL